MNTRELKAEFIAAIALTGMIYGAVYIASLQPAFPMSCEGHPQSDGLLLREAIKQRGAGEAISCAFESYNGNLARAAGDLWHKLAP